MKDSLIKILTQLDNAYGVSGNEEAVIYVLKDLMEDLFDEYFEDALGNQYYTKYGKKKEKSVAFVAHMDEIGFAVSYIEENGMARLLPVGFHDERLSANQQMTVITKTGTVNGVTGTIPFHFLSSEDMEKPLKIADLCLDFGTASREETKALGVDVGDYATFSANGGMLNGGPVYCGKSVDNRAGCAVLVELMRQLKAHGPEVTTHAVFSVQEEVGMRAGGPIAYRLNPDLFVGLDLTLARGIPGIEWNMCHTEMNKGVAINYFDWDPELGMTGNNIPRKVTNYFESLAQQNDIPYQKVVLTGGGTDAWSAATAGGGVLCGGIFIPSQYVHSAVGTVHINDLISTTRLLVEVTKKFPF